MLVHATLILVVRTSVKRLFSEKQGVRNVEQQFLFRRINEYAGHCFCLVVRFANTMRQRQRCGFFVVTGFDLQSGLSTLSQETIRQMLHKFAHRCHNDQSGHRRLDCVRAWCFVCSAALSYITLRCGIGLRTGCAGICTSKEEMGGKQKNRHRD